MSRGLMLIISLCVALALAGCGDSSSTGGDSTTAVGPNPEITAANLEAAGPEDITKRGKPKVVPPQGPPPKELTVDDLIEGTGPAAKPGDELTVRYVGVGYLSGIEFDSSWGGRPFVFELGRGSVIDGLDEGLAGMRAGGRRELIVAPALAYGAKGTEVIAPNATLVFVVDLLAVG